MNVFQIDHKDIFIYDFAQIIEKNFILDRYKDSTIVFSDKYKCDLSSVLDWFNYYLSKSFKNFEEISRNISEDICILANIDNVYRLVYINVSFPNRYRPIENINYNISEILNQNLKASKTKIEIFFQNMPENTPFRREYWGFSNTDNLYLPDEEKYVQGNENFIRREIQTLIKVNTFIILLTKTEIIKSHKEEIKLSNNINSNYKMKNYKRANSKL